MRQIGRQVVQAQPMNTVSWQRQPQRDHRYGVDSEGIADS